MDLFCVTASESTCHKLTLQQLSSGVVLRPLGEDEERWSVC